MTPASKIPRAITQAKTGRWAKKLLFMALVPRRYRCPVLGGGVGAFGGAMVTFWPGRTF